MIKLLSGRFFLMICAGIGFLYCIWTKQLDPAAISAIIVGVYNSYFLRNDRNGKDNKGDKNGDNN